MSFIARQEAFGCEHCGTDVQPLTNGSYRNHCPTCLYSKHVDKDGPGDRQSTCHGLMRPVGLDYRSGKGWMIVHLCKSCDKRILNKTAPDDDLSVITDNKS